MANSYTDENGVYRNKQGFTNADQLGKYEYEVVAARSREILAGKIDLGIKEHSLKRLSAIHEHLFKDVYDWAGKLRTVPSSKRADSGTVSRFAEADKIVENWQELEKRATGFVSAAVSSLGQRSESLAEIFIEANRIHAFPEGNGRSLQVFMKELAKEQYVELDYTKITPDAWNRASAISGMHGRFFEHIHFIQSPSDAEPMRQIFAIMARDSRARAVETLSQEQACAKFPELRPAYVGLRLIEERAGESFGGDAQRVSSYMHEVRLAFVKRLNQGESVTQALSPANDQSRSPHRER